MIERKIDEYINPYGFIYCIQNKINGKRYIGATTEKKGVRTAWRLNSLKNTYNQHLINSIKKYGLENFKRIRLDSAKNKKKLDLKEEFYIQKYNTLNRDNGYNFKHGGIYGKHLEETKQKISKAHKGRIHTPESRKNMSEAHKGQTPWNKGKKASDEMKKRLSELRKGTKLSTEHKKKISDSLKGRIKSEETRRKLSEANKGQIPWIKGKHHSKETKKKISEAQKGEKGNNYGKKHSEEQKHKISEGLKRHYKEKRRKMEDNNNASIQT